MPRVQATSCQQLLLLYLPCHAIPIRGLMGSMSTVVQLPVGTWYAFHSPFGSRPHRSSHLYPCFLILTMQKEAHFSSPGHGDLRRLCSNIHFFLNPAPPGGTFAILFSYSYSLHPKTTTVAYDPSFLPLHLVWLLNTFSLIKPGL